MAKKSVLTSPRLEELKRKRRRAFWKKAFIFIFLFLVIVVGLSYGSKNQRINVANIEVVGNKVIDTEIIKNVAREEMKGNYLFFFPKTNSILYPKGAIKDKLNTEYKRLKNISIKLKDLRTILISVNEREIKYTWCGTQIKNDNVKEEDLKCYFLDNEGFIFDEAPYFSQDVYIRFYGSGEINIDNPVGSSFAQNIFPKLISFKDSIEKMNLKPKAFYVEENNEIKMFLPKRNNEYMPEVIFKSNANFEKIAENLQSALTTEPLQTEFKDKYSSLLYLDLRYDNKVLYKFR